MVLGAIADDVTGATDLASVLRRAGCSVVLTLGTPRAPLPSVDAIVVATKSRTAPLEDAKRMVVQAADLLSRAGAEALYFKYCSTFDSTKDGNIGPIIDLLLARQNSDFTVACPSYPNLARTVYQGHLFVGDRLLSESPMRRHPLTPMHDPDLVRFLATQTAHPVGLVALSEVEAGPERIRARFAELRAAGCGIGVADAIFNIHIEALGQACRDMPLVTGGAALGGALARARMGSGRSASPAAGARPPGPTAILSGSCSAMTLTQVGRAAARLPSMGLDPVALVAGPEALQRTVEWAMDQAGRGDFLIYSTAAPEQVTATQAQLGGEAAAAAVEGAFAAIARALADAGVRNFVVAGGETSGAVTKALDIRMMSFGDEIAPGVPWTYALDPEGYRLALKSGNFGGPDFLLQAIESSP